MFCMYCGGMVSPNNEVCPDCGKHLDAHSRVLNPIPRKVIDINPDTETTIHLNSEEVEIQEQIQNTFSDDISDTEDKPNSNMGPVVMQFGYKENNTPLPDVQPMMNNNPVPASLEESTETEAKASRDIIAILTFILIIAAIIAFFLLHNRFNNKSNDATEKSTNTAVATSEEEATNSDASDEINSVDNLTLQEDTLIGKKDITINEEVYSAENLTHLTDADNNVEITECYYKLTNEEAQRYMDEQEVLYQLQDTSVLDVVYLDGLYRYHYKGVYQYGYYCNDCLYIYEINDSLDVNSCDNLASEYFSEEVIKNEK